MLTFSWLNSSAVSPICRVRPLAPELVYLTEKKGTTTALNANSTIDYNKNDLQGTSAAKDGNWKGLVKFAGMSDTVLMAFLIS